MSNPAFANGSSYSDNVSTTLAITNNSFGVVAGDVIVCVVATYCDTVVPGPGTMADNQGNTFTRLLSISNSTTDRVRLDLFVSPPLAASVAISGYTVTATANGSNGANTEQGFNFQRWTGFGAVGAALDVSGTALLAAATASGTVTLSSGTAAQAVEAIIAGVHFNDSANPDGLATPTGTGTWVSDYNNTNATIGLATSVAHQVTSATGTAYSATWSGMDTTSNNGGVFLIAALTPATAPGVPVLGALPPSMGPGVSPSLQGKFTKSLRSGTSAPKVLALTGKAATFGTGTLTPNRSIALTGKAATFAAGTINAGIASQGYIPKSGPGVSPDPLKQFRTPPLSSFTLTTPDITLTLSGQAATFSAGLLTPSNALTLTGQAATFAAGAMTLGVSVALTGQAATFVAGAVTPSLSLALIGQAATFAAGSITPSMSIALTGQAATFAAGTLTPSTTIGLTGQAATFSAGTVTYSAGGNLTLALTGQPATFAAGTVAPSITIAIAGQAATFAAGSLGVQYAFSLTGQPATFAAGNLVPSRAIALLGQNAAFTAGTVVATNPNITRGLSGQQAKFRTGALVASGGTLTTVYTETWEIGGPSIQVRRYTGTFPP